MSTPRRVIARAPGDASQLSVQTFAPAAPGPGEVLIRHTAIGINFIDIYIRSGLYPWPVDKDLVLGSEGAGVIEAVGEEVTDLAAGQRVAYTLPNGAYSTHRVIAAAHVVPLPDGIDGTVAAASMLKGLTAAYLLKHSYAVQAGQSVLFHAAAGGVGSFAGQWLNALGVRAIGTAGGPEKCAVARAHGFEHVIDYHSEDVAEQVMALTDGQGVHAVYDSVGADTLRASLASLRRFGTLVCFGQSSGPATDFRISDLAAGSFFLTRPTVFHFTSDRQWLLHNAAELFERIGRGDITVRINQRFSLDDAAEAHRQLEARQTTGCSVLLPDQAGTRVRNS